MGTKHGTGSVGTGAGTAETAGKGEDAGTRVDAGTGADARARADVPAPAAKRSRRAVLTVVLGAIATLVSAVATLMAAASARVTYYLPPPDGSTEAVERHDWLESVLALIPVSLLDGLLALAMTVLGIVALVRGRKSAPWQPVLAGLALVVALAVLVAVPFLHNGVGTH